MDSVPSRSSLATGYRAILKIFEKIVPLPNINPSWYQVSGILVSFGVLYLDGIGLKMIFISLALVFDWLDGATARRYLTLTKQGYMTDVVYDRLSEGIIFAGEMAQPVGFYFFGLWVINTLLSIISIKTGKHHILPLRFLYLFGLAYQL